MAFRDRLREARQLAGMTQSQLALRLELSDRGYRKLEDGSTRQPSMKTLRLLQEITGRDAEWFIGGDEPGRPGPRSRSPQPSATGPRSAREAVLDESHYLGFMMNWAGYTTLESRLAVADKMDARFTQFGTVTPALASLFLEGIRSEFVPPAPPRTKRSRGWGK